MGTLYYCVTRCLINLSQPLEDTVKESIRMTEDRHKWRKYVHGAANPRIEDGQEQNRTVGIRSPD